jgi:hypothetical protein
MKRWIQLAAKLQEWFTQTRQQPPAAAGAPIMGGIEERSGASHHRQPPAAVGSSTRLRCREVVDLIPQYLEEGTLEPGKRQAFEAHIADCVNCWRFLKTYRETMALGRQLREEALPPTVRGRLGTFVRSYLRRSS